MLFDRGGLPADSLGGADCGVGTLFWMGSQPWLKVNLNGERFCNESGTYDFVLHSDAQQPGSIHVTLWDADFATYAEQFDTDARASSPSTTAPRRTSPSRRLWA